jgi:hypothetical protein
MFRSFTIAAGACAVALALATVPVGAVGKTKAVKEHALVGTLAKVDGQTMTVKTSTGEQSVMLASATHITQNGKAIQVSQLSSDTGSRVKVRYTEANGQKQARVVTVSPASKDPKK